MRAPVVDSVLELIGNTPMVRLSRVAPESGPRVFAKLEYANPGGSIKDRVGLAMLLAAEKSGRIKPGYTIVEPTSGNTGMGLALASVLRGYKIVFTVPDKMSRDKVDLLRAFGAKVIVTPSNVPANHPASYVKVAERLVKETPNSYMPNQYENPANPAIHYATTGPEIWQQTKGKVDVLVAGVGTGGTISGTGRFLKEQKPSVKVVGADPEGSLIAAKFYGRTPRVHPYRIEGIGEDFMPSTLDLKVIDEVVTVSDKDAFLTARRLAKEEGILAGGSGGAAVFAALRVAEKTEKGKTIVVIIPDTGRSYLNKVYNDDWMSEYGFIEVAETRISVDDLLRTKSRRIRKLVFVSPQDSLAKAIRLLKKYDVSHLPVLQGKTSVGSLSEASIMKKLNSKQASARMSVADVMDEPFPTVRRGDAILNPLDMFRGKGAVIVIDGPTAVGIISTIDVINYLAKR